MIQSRGALVPYQVNGAGLHGYTGYGAFVTHLPDIHQTHLYRQISYAEMYRRHPAVFTVVDKLAQLTARLPLKVYRRTRQGREEVRQDRYARLLRSPNPRQDHNLFWRTISANYDIYGEAIALKIRDDATGVPTELWPLPPFCVETYATDAGAIRYRIPYQDGLDWPDTDIVHFRTYNPDNMLRGLSPLEPLRSTLENEAAARESMASFWNNGARPGTVLRHPKNLSEGAQQRLKAQFEELYAGARNTGKTVLLEEDMDVKAVSLSAKEAQYIDSRKLNREEVWSCYHMPPTALGDLSRATYSNITENLRSVYRDTVAPRLESFEAVLEAQLRPEFGTNEYAEFLMDEVLRGAFEARAEAYQRAIHSGWMTPAEVRELENLPAIPGAEQLFVNQNMVPISQVTNPPDTTPALESGEQPE